jgi:hypothetical protein
MTMQLIAENIAMRYFSNQYCFILSYTFDSIGLIPLSILLLPHLVVQKKLFYQIQL